MTRKIAISGLVIAAYVAATLLLGSISYGQIQVRFSTGLYVLAHFYPFLVVPLGLANAIANFFGPFGIYDALGGFVVGVLTSWAVTKMKADLLVPLPVALVVPAVVGSYLFLLLRVPFLPLLLYLLAGQTIAAYTAGLILVKVFRRLPGSLVDRQ